MDENKQKYLAYVSNFCVTWDHAVANFSFNYKSMLVSGRLKCAKGNISIVCKVPYTLAILSPVIKSTVHQQLTKVFDH
jgi:hypothetical protein